MGTFIGFLQMPHLACALCVTAEYKSRALSAASQLTSGWQMRDVHREGLSPFFVGKSHSKAHDPKSYQCMLSCMLADRHAGAPEGNLKQAITTQGYTLSREVVLSLPGILRSSLGAKVRLLQYGLNRTCMDGRAISMNGFSKLPLLRKRHLRSTADYYPGIYIRA
ncbi:hypothetical protein BDR03DRAFT_66971 [Suillus americanus]|nr:hypothetical protein BDR03DRAFT_66971 [Suillus americanus]